jgi:6-phosphofructokinase 1
VLGADRVVIDGSLSGGTDRSLTIEPWDYRYYQEKVRKQRYNLTQEEVKPYFELNNIIEAVDKIKDTAGSTHRAFIVEVMGDQCGYLPLMSALACGAERAYLPEDGIALDDLAEDVEDLREGFRSGKALGIFVMGENASRHYNTDVIRRVMQEEGQDEFEVRACILGHVQRGGAPTPFDRIQASRFANDAIIHLLEQIREDDNAANVIGLLGKRIEVTPLDQAMALLDASANRPSAQWWYDLNSVLERLSLTPK